MIAGDFNLIREPSDKSSPIYNQSLIDFFNNFIGNHNLREIKRSGPKFSWTNKQSLPTLVNLDRFFVSTDWELRFPLCSAWSLTRVGSDHSPIVLDSGEHGAPRSNYFFFENKWLLEPDFTSLVSEKWQEAKGRRPESCYLMDGWHGNLCMTR